MAEERRVLNSENVLQLICDFYLKRGGFNGIPISSLQKEFNAPLDLVAPIIGELVQSGRISLNFGDRHPNPHVKALAPQPVEVQLSKFGEKNDFNHVCVYPENCHLVNVVDPRNYDGRPFDLELALGMPCLTYLNFELTALELYRNDPRYYYECNDVGGRISVHTDSGLKEADEAYLQSFGFSYNEKLSRAVAVLVSDLSKLTPEHQRIWATKRLGDEYSVHPGFAAIVAGEWDLKLSLFDAFAMELGHINAMMEIIGKPPLFRTVPLHERRPKEFAFLLRPTKKEFHDFVLLLDKLMSDNLIHDFFKNEALDLEEDVKRPDGKIEVRKKGTISLLKEWLLKHFKPRDPTPRDKLLETFREVRTLRMAPAHKLDDNVFDQDYFQQQRHLMIRACEAVRTIRLILQNHPALKTYEVEEELYKGEIWTY